MDSDTDARTPDLDGVLDAETVEGLKQLCDPGDLSLFHDLVDTFLGDTPSRLDAIDAAVAATDAGGVERAAHAMRSSSANMGALGLASLCKQLESLGRGGQVEGCSDLARRAREEFERVRAAYARLRA